MQRIKLDQDIKPLSEFRANATACLQQVHDTRRPMIITQHGKSSAVLMGVHEYEQLIEKLELLQEIKLAEAQLENKQGISHKAAKQRIMKKYKQ
jgi:antitoxin YefM